jgi:hypothetical protein
MLVENLYLQRGELTLGSHTRVFAAIHETADGQYRQPDCDLTGFAENALLEHLRGGSFRPF